jgi:hypothetical protein
MSPLRAVVVKSGLDDAGQPVSDYFQITGVRANETDHDSVHTGSADGGQRFCGLCD